MQESTPKLGIRVNVLSLPLPDMSDMPDTPKSTCPIPAITWVEQRIKLRTTVDSVACSKTQRLHRIAGIYGLANPPTLLQKCTLLLPLDSRAFGS